MSKIFTKNIVLIICVLVMSFSVQAQEWVELENLLVPRTDMASTIMGDTLYIFGGTIPSGEVTTTSNEVLRFDMVNLEWLPPAPALNYARASASAVTLNGNILVFGGRTNQDSFPSAVELWNPSMENWSVVGELDLPRAGMRATVVGDDIFYSGGVSSGGETHSRTNVINLHEQDTTYSINISLLTHSLPSPRSYHAMESVGTRLFLFGGYDSWSLSDAYVLSSSGWNALETMPTALAGMASTVFYVADQPLIVLSGGRNESAEVQNIRYFHADNLLWSDDFPLIDDLPSARSGHIMESFEDKIFVAGGSFRNTVGERILLSDMIVYLHPTTHSPQHPETVVPEELKVIPSPNPSNGNITISINPVSNEDIDIIVYNILGQPVTSWNLLSTGSAQRLSWDGKTIAGNDIPAGVYFLVAKQGGQQQTQKLIRLP